MAVTPLQRTCDVASEYNIHVIIATLLHTKYVLTYMLSTLLVGRELLLTLGPAGDADLGLVEEALGHREARVGEILAHRLRQLLLLDLGDDDASVGDLAKRVVAADLGRGDEALVLVLAGVGDTVARELRIIVLVLGVRTARAPPAQPVARRPAERVEAEPDAPDRAEAALLRACRRRL